MSGPSKSRIAPAKISPPRLGAHVPRKALFELLDSESCRPVVWIAAPAGAGKTTLASGYLAERQARVLWYQLDVRDADPATFFYYFREAVRNLSPRKRETLPLLTPEYLLNLAVFARNFFEEAFQRLHAPSVLVFDNYQDVPDESPLHQVLADGFAAVPAATRVFVLSRATPPVSFSRLRGQGALRTIEADALSVTLDEAFDLARSRRLAHLSPETIALLHARTLGWAAGLVLLLERASRTPVDAATLPQVEHDALFDYFAAEVFRHSDPSEQELLMKTSLMPAFTADMAMQLTDNRNASLMLNRLVRRNFFTVKHLASSPSYEYHPLFRVFLLARAKASYEGCVLADLSIRSATLLEADGQIEAAANLIRESGDVARLSEFILRHAATLLEQGRGGVVHQWLSALSAERVDRNPWLLFWRGVCVLPFAPGDAKRLLESALFRFRDAGDARGAFLAWTTATEAVWHEAQSLADFDRWIGLLPDLGPDADQPQDVQDAVTVGMLAALTMRQPNHPDLPLWVRRGIDLLESEGRAVGKRVAAGTYLASATLWGGRGIDEDRIMERVTALVRAHDLPPIVQINFCVIESMHAWRVRADYQWCQAAAERGLELARKTGVHIWDYILLTQIFAGALTAGDLDNCERLLRRLTTNSLGLRNLDMVSMRYFACSYALERDDLAGARAHLDIIESKGKDLGLPFANAGNGLARAQYETRLGHFEDAARLLESVDRINETARSPSITFFAGLCRADLATRRSDEPTAREALRAAFGCAREFRLLNTHGLRPRLLAAMAAKALESDIETAYVRSLIKLRRLAPPASSRQLQHWPWPVRVFMLGRFAVEVDDEPLTFTHKTQRRPLALLSALIAYGGREVPLARVVSAIWPDAEADQGHASLVSALHRLRKLIGHDQAVLLADNRLTLNDRIVWVDAWAFEHAIEARAGEPSREDALALYKGVLTAPDSDVPWIFSVRERLRARFVRGVAEVARAYRDAGRHAEAIDLLERGVEADAVAEELYRDLIRNHLDLGRRSEALRVYGRCRDKLAEMLGIGPDAETEALYRLTQEISEA